MPGDGKINTHLEETSQPSPEAEETLAPPPSGLSSPDSPDSGVTWTPAPKRLASSAESPTYPRVLTDAELKWPSEWHLIALMSAQGYSQRYIAGHLNYTESSISLIVNRTEVQERIERIRREDSSNLTRRYSQIAPRALDYFERVVDGQEDSNVNQRLTAAQWILEKHSGKPKQEVLTDGGTTILQVLQALDAMKAAQAASAPRTVSDIEVTPKEEKEADPLADWVSANVPQGGISE